jgi:hypothetical protein
MGYTHYWRFNEQPAKEKFAEFVEGAKQLVATAQEAGVEIGDEKYDWNLVVFNGVGAGAHESFFFDYHDFDFGFCKTAQKPYDMVVTASLILAKKIFGDDITVTSDGKWTEWESGQLLYESVYDVRPENVLGKVDA